MTGIILGILGLTATIILGYYGIILTRKSRQTVRLTVKRVECFSLFSSAIRKLKIDISYIDKKIENPLILFKGEIINTGSLDIDKTSIYEPLKLISSEHFNWLELNILKEDQKINSAIQKINEKEIIINWDLLKKGEKISFEALIESIDNKEIGKTDAIEFYNSLDFSYRITNLDKIQCDDKIDNSKIFSKKLIDNLILLTVSILFGSSLILLPMLNKYLGKSSDFIDVYYEIARQKKDTIISTIIPVTEKQIFLENIDKTEKTIALDDFKSNYQIIKVHSTKASYIVNLSKYFGSGVLILSILVFFVDTYIFKYRRKKPKR